MGTGRKYDEEYKKQAIKLAKEMETTAQQENWGNPKEH